MKWQQENKPIQVVGVDYPCLDYIIETERLPKTNDEVDIRKESWQGGGMVPTALVALSRLGVRSGIIGVMGDDAYGAYCLADFKRHHVDTTMIVEDPGTTTDFCISVAERSTNGRSFLTRWGNCRRLRREDLSEAYIAQAEYLHLCMEMNEINVQAAKIAKQNGVKVVIDADHYSERTEAHLDLIDVFIAGEKYYRAGGRDKEPEAYCKEILAKGPSIVVFTLGSNGCIGMDQNGFFEVDAFHLQPIVDTTGAGDVFHGAFIKGLLDGKSAKECALFASAVAAIKCLRLGGRAGIPDLETTERFLQTGQVGLCDFQVREEYYRSGLAALLQQK